VRLPAQTYGRNRRLVNLKNSVSEGILAVSEGVGMRLLALFAHHFRQKLAFGNAGGLEFFF
jgi:hypothetical protein